MSLPQPTMLLACRAVAARPVRATRRRKPGPKRWRRKASRGQAYAQNTECALRLRKVRRLWERIGVSPNERRRSILKTQDRHGGRSLVQRKRKESIARAALAELDVSSAVRGKKRSGIEGKQGRKLQKRKLQQGQGSEEASKRYETVWSTGRAICRNLTHSSTLRTSRSPRRRRQRVSTRASPSQSGPKPDLFADRPPMCRCIQLDRSTFFAGPTRER